MTDQELKDLVASLAEDRKEMHREFILRQKEADKRREEFDRQMEDLGKKIKEVSDQIGGIGNNSGYHAEQFFQDVFERKKEFGGIKYDEVHPNYGRNDDVGKIDIDILLLNGNSVALIEVKNRIHPEFVTKFAEERVGKFRELYPKFNDYKIYLGIAGFSFDKKVTAKAKEYGIGIVKQVGEGVEIEAENLKAY